MEIKYISSFRPTNAHFISFIESINFMMESPSLFKSCKFYHACNTYHTMTSSMMTSLNISPSLMNYHIVGTEFPFQQHGKSLRLETSPETFLSRCHDNQQQQPTNSINKQINPPINTHHHTITLTVALMTPLHVNLYLTSSFSPLLSFRGLLFLLLLLLLFL